MLMKRPGCVTPPSRANLALRAPCTIPAGSAGQKPEPNEQGPSFRPAPVVI